jgi:predicted anti-sigma-YlaC factor YlaD
MDCRDAQELWFSYLEGEIDARPRGEIDQHLAGCSLCNHRYERATILVQDLSLLPRILAPTGFEAMVMQSIRRHEARPAPRFLPGVAAVLALVGGFLTLLGGPTLLFVIQSLPPSAGGTGFSLEDRIGDVVSWSGVFLESLIIAAASSEWHLPLGIALLLIASLFGLWALISGDQTARAPRAGRGSMPIAERSLRLGSGRA